MSTAHEIQLPVFSEDEQNLESLLQDTQTRLFALRKQKEESTTAANRASRLERLKEALAENERGLHELEGIGINQAYATLEEAVAERYATCNGNSSLYGKYDASVKVNNASAKLVGLLDAVLRRAVQLEKQRKDVAELQSQVDGDVARAAKNAK